MKNITRSVLIVVVLLYSMTSYCQTNIKSAISAFDKHEYQTAISLLEAALPANERDAKTNYYLGASYVAARTNISEGIRRLRFAQLKKFIGDSDFYLGRAYQLNFEFEQGIASFTKFLKTARDQQLIDQAQLHLNECRASVQLASKIFSVRVIDKYMVAPDSLLHVYSPSKDVGTIARNSSFFESDIDPDGILYRTERGDEVYFTNMDSEGHDKIFKMERLLDGWGDVIPLQLVSNGNEKTPVLMTDGSTLYFASDRPGGFGGYDIYRSTYDPDTRRFTEPVNMGLPFNSAFDDFLFVADEFRKRAWFTSNRETHSDSLVVYEILWDESVIRNYAQTTEDIRRMSRLSVDKSLVSMRDDVTSAGVRKGGFSVTKDAKMFEFQINDSLTYTQWEHFRSPEALKKYREAFATQQKKDSLSNVMAAMRKEFLKDNSDDKRNEIIAEVLKVERVVYNLEDQLGDMYDVARFTENQHITSLVNSGKYTPLSAVVAKNSVAKFDWDALLVPDYYEMYSPMLLQDVRKKNNELYYAVFSMDEIDDLQAADSLYAWAGILALEAQKMNERSMAGESAVTFDEMGKKVRMDASGLAERSAYLSKASAVLYSKALDQKYDIFEDRYEAAVEAEPNVNFTEITVLKKSAARDFSLVDNVTLADGVVQLQKAIVMKKKGMGSFTEAMSRYASHKDGSFPLPNKQAYKGEPVSVADALNNDSPVTEPTPVQTVTADNVAVAETHPQKNNAEQIPVEKPAEKPVEKVAEKPTPVVVDNAGPSDATASPYGPGKPVYRIQLGVFRNAPDASKMAGFSVVTSQPIPDKGLTKYFCGAYRTYSEAAAEVLKVQASGFDGAFIVAFLNGDKVSLSVAQKAE